MGASLHSTTFNENLFIDEFEVVLNDGTHVMLCMYLDDASSFRVVVPTTGLRSLGSRLARECLDRGWLSWAGPPDRLYYDKTKGHLGEEFASLGEEFSMELVPVPAEAWWLKARIERAIDFWKDLYSRVNQSCNLTEDDDPFLWTSRITWACNTHLRKNGFSPYQYVLGRNPRVPASVTETLESQKTNLTAHWWVLNDDGARRSEEIRAAASRAFYELDSDEHVR